jgi:hypothetical protein
MIVDLAKIFPKSCSKNGVEQLIINTLSITNISIDEETKPAEYIVQLGKVVYRFSSIDCKIDGAIELLAGINMCEKLPKIYSDLDNLMSVDTTQEFEDVTRLNKEFLNDCEAKYGAKRNLPEKSLN